MPEVNLGHKPETKEQQVLEEEIVVTSGEDEIYPKNPSRS
jgi:hypothetical protein